MVKTRVGTRVETTAAELSYAISEKETHALVYALLMWQRSCLGLTHGWRLQH
jgi:hypothetical protein